MNFAELTQELLDRGANYLDEDASQLARAQRWINQAYKEMCNLHAWPFLQASATGGIGAGTVSVPDLRKVRFVGDISNGTTPGRRLRKILLEDLESELCVEDASTTGTPEFYYIEAGSMFNTYPVGGTVYVAYTKRVQPLTGTDTPVFAEDYHDLIVDRAMIKVYKDSDNFEAAAALKDEYNAGLAAMAEDYQLDTREGDYVDVGWPYDG